MARLYEDLQTRLAPPLRDVTSVGEVISVAADRWGDDSYLTYAPNDETFTFDDIDKWATQIGEALASIGVNFGDRVGLFLTNSPVYVAAIYGTAKIGAIETPINWQYREREVIHAIESAEIATVVVEPDDEMVNTLHKAAAEVPRLEQVVLSKSHPAEKLRALSDVTVHVLDELTTDEPDGGNIEAPSRDDPVSILYTSGTTGLPKPSVLTNRSFLLAAKSMLGAPFASNDVNYNPYPLFHANNQCYSMLASAIHGSEYVLSDTFSVETFWKEVTSNDVTSFNLIGGVPKILQSRFAQEDIPPNDLALAIGPISTELWEPFEERFGLTVIQIYSQTESPTLLMNHPDSSAIKVGSIGKAMFPDLGHEVSIEPTDSDTDDIGELIRSDPGAMEGYWNLPEKTTETLREGRIYSGDIVRRDDDDYLYYVDRKKFMIRRSGENISAQEVEEVINELDGVEESAVIPVPDEIRGEEVKAMVTYQSSDIGPQEVVDVVADTLAPFKVPRYVEFVEEFPRTPTERIRRVELADREADKSEHGWDREQE